jgi:hypothetical protein
METKKDPAVQENIDRNKEAEKDWESHHTTTDRYPEEAKGIGETDVKNAHAAGDGAFGRSEASLPDDDKNDGKEEDNQPY